VVNNVDYITLRKFYSTRPVEVYSYINSTIPNVATVVPRHVWSALKDKDSPQVLECFHVSVHVKPSTDVTSEDSSDSDEDPYAKYDKTSSPRYSPTPSAMPDLTDDFVEWNQLQETLPPDPAPKVFKSFHTKSTSITKQPPTPQPVAPINVHAHFSHAEVAQPTAYTVSGEPILSDKFEDMVKYAYNKGAEDILNIVLKRLVDADDDDKVIVIDSSSSSNSPSEAGPSSAPYHSHASPIPLRPPPYSPSYSPIKEEDHIGPVRGTKSKGRFTPYARKA
jgi:hypothetical protein